jgi:predicted O-methyltransferase YrrM
MLLTISVTFCFTNNFSNVEIIDIDIPDEKEDATLLDRTKLYVEMSESETKFLSYLIRRYKPKKIVEIGVSSGGSSVVILNAIKDIYGAKLYSIDLSKNVYKCPSKPVGFVVHKYFSHLMKNNWRLYTGNITAKFMDEIGGDIDFVFIDTVHRNPGEILDFLQILPYLKAGAIVVFHDTSFHFLERSDYNGGWTNCALLSVIRGQKIIPHKDLLNGVALTFPNIGAIKLDDHQEKFAFDYFNMLVLPWYYFPNKEQINLLRDFFKKHYDSFCSDIFERAVSKHNLYMEYPKEPNVVDLIMVLWKTASRIGSRIITFLKSQSQNSSQTQDGKQKCTP